MVDLRFASTTRIMTSAVSLSSLEIRSAPALRIVRRGLLDEASVGPLLLLDESAAGFASVPPDFVAIEGNLDLDFRAK